MRLDVSEEPDGFPYSGIAHPPAFSRILPWRLQLWGIAPYAESFCHDGAEGEASPAREQRERQYKAFGDGSSHLHRADPEALELLGPASLPQELEFRAHRENGIVIYVDYLVSRLEFTFLDYRMIVLYRCKDYTVLALDGLDFLYDGNRS